jgi:hypothetical protein
VSHPPTPAAWLDPWRDARAITAALGQPAAGLLVAIGAEAWCTRCRVLRPRFESLRAAVPTTTVVIWLDLDLHAEFIGALEPEDLPLLLHWRGSNLVAAGLLRAVEPAPLRVDLVPLALPHPEPPIRQRLVAAGASHA